MRLKPKLWKKILVMGIVEVMGSNPLHSWTFFSHKLIGLSYVTKEIALWVKYFSWLNLENKMLLKLPLICVHCLAVSSSFHLIIDCLKEIKGKLAWNNSLFKNVTFLAMRTVRPVSKIWTANHPPRILITFVC